MYTRGQSSKWRILTGRFTRQVIHYSRDAIDFVRDSQADSLDEVFRWIPEVRYSSHISTWLLKSTLLDEQYQS